MLHLYLTSYNYIIGDTKLMSLGMHLGMNRISCPQFLYLGDEHIFMIIMSIKNGMYLLLCIIVSFPEPPKSISGVGSLKCGLEVL